MTSDIETVLGWWDAILRKACHPSRFGGGTVAETTGDVTLSDGVVTLRFWRHDDAPAVFAACQDPLIGRFVPIPQPYSEDDARTFIEMRRRDRDGGDEQGFAIVDASTDELLGAISRHGPFGHRAMFGYWLAPAARGRGVATRSLRLIIDWTLATTAVIRLELYTDVENDASGRVAQRAGFEREGVRRAWDLDRDGRPMDVMFYVRIRGDEPPHPIDPVVRPEGS
jgi:RimJ/RimL family protein N-acetyltransferase